MLKEDDEDFEEEDEKDCRSANRGSISAVFSVIFSVVSGEFLNTQLLTDLRNILDVETVVAVVG